MANNRMNLVNTATRAAAKCGAVLCNRARHDRDQSLLHENSGCLHENSSKVE
jgi:hypothetical protein